MNKNFKPLHEQIANKLIAALQAGTSPFQKPWKDNDAPAFTIPVNPTTNKNYRGMNSLWLSMQGYSDPRWMTLKQADFAGYTVKEGAKATLINFIKTHNIEAMRDPDGNKIKDGDGKTMTRTTELDKPTITKAWVFNAEQINGVPPLAEYLKEKQGKQQWNNIERAENLLSESKATINHGGNEAYYNKTKDHIQLPLKEQFENETKYYAVALHELGHWTGHESRLKRPMEGRFGSEQYAREELRAEIASLMMGSELQIGHNFGQHAAYVNSWVKILKDEPFELFRASADAQKIFDFIMAMEQKRELKQENSASKTLAVGDQVPYNNTEYKVLEKKGKTFTIEDQTTMEKIKMQPNYGLFKKLVEAKNNPAAQELVAEGLGEQVENVHKIGR
jgi:antirestriction protein ArdC